MWAAAKFLIVQCTSCQTAATPTHTNNEGGKKRQQRQKIIKNISITCAVLRCVPSPMDDSVIFLGQLHGRRVKSRVCTLKSTYIKLTQRRLGGDEGNLRPNSAARGSVSSVSPCRTRCESDDSDDNTQHSLRANKLNYIYIRQIYRRYTARRVDANQEQQTRRAI